MGTNNSINLSTPGITGYNGSGTFTGTAVTQYNVIVGGSATDTLANIAPSTSGYALTSTGASSNPTFANEVSVPGGGTGAGSFTQNSLILGNSTSALSALGAATNGQIPIGSTSSAPVLATLTAGTGIGIVNGAGSITINGTGGGITWAVVTASTQSAAVNNGYIANYVGTLVITLPATSAVGSIIRVTGINATNGWQIAQPNAGSFINMGTSATTTGTGGYLQSTNYTDTVELLAITANAGWQVISSMGNPTVH
jgi:hypothetical protein